MFNEPDQLRAYGYPSKGLQSLLAAHCIPVDTSIVRPLIVAGALLLLNHVNPRGDTYLRELLQYLSNPAVGMPAASA